MSSFRSAGPVNLPSIEGFQRVSVVSRGGELVPLLWKETTRAPKAVIFDA
jgi:hypothetical protein